MDNVAGWQQAAVCVPHMTAWVTGAPRDAAGELNELVVKLNVEGEVTQVRACDFDDDHHFRAGLHPGVMRCPDGREGVDGRKPGKHAPDK